MSNSFIRTVRTLVRMCLATISVISITSCDESPRLSGVTMNCPPAKSLSATLVLDSGEDFVVSAKSFDLAACAPFLKGDFFWGSTDVPPHTFVGEMSARIGNSQLEIPAGAYLDLGDASDIRAKKHEAQVEVTIKGTGESAWIATYYFDKIGVLRRSVWNQDFPDESRQETTFSYVDN